MLIFRWQVPVGMLIEMISMDNFWLSLIFLAAFAFFCGSIGGVVVLLFMHYATKKENSDVIHQNVRDEFITVNEARAVMGFPPADPVDHEYLDAIDTQIVPNNNGNDTPGKPPCSNQPYGLTGKEYDG